MSLTPKKLGLQSIAGSKRRVRNSPCKAVGCSSEESFTMAATTSTTRAREPAMWSAPAASKDMAGTAPEHAASTKAAVEAGSDMLQTMSRMIYSGCYALAYGI
jgi:hypothetical protein